LIEHLAPAILIPRRFVPANSEDRTAATALEWAGKYLVEDIAIAASVEHWDLGLGEAQVIARCVDGSKWAVLDDRAARRCAAAHEVRVIGTLGVVLRAKKAGQVGSARPLVRELVAAACLRAMSSWRALRPASGNEKREHKSPGKKPRAWRPAMRPRRSQYQSDVRPAWR